MLRTPEILQLPDQRMAVVRTIGDPSEVARVPIAALYSAVYDLQFALKQQGRSVTLGALRARWPRPLSTPRADWLGIWALPVPADTTALKQKVPGIAVTVEDWAYGTVAQVVHTGPYAEEAETIGRLLAFIAAQGYDVAGPHEEEYLTRPTAKLPRTLIRYQIRPQAGLA